MWRPLLALAAATPPPHIVFILVDDLGWADVGFNLRDGPAQFASVDFGHSSDLTPLHCWYCSTLLVLLSGRGSRERIPAEGANIEFRFIMRVALKLVFSTTSHTGRSTQSHGETRRPGGG